MVEDQVGSLIARKGSLLLVEVDTATNTDEADNLVLALGNETSTIEGYAFARSSLSFDSDIVGTDKCLACDVDNAAYIEDDDTVRTADGIGKRACATGVEVGDMIDTAVASADRECSEALGTGKARVLPLTCSVRFLLGV